MARKTGKKRAQKKHTGELQDIVRSIQDKYGEESVVIMGEYQPSAVEVIPSGNYYIDKATGVGGFPRGRLVEVYGPEGGGKTTLCNTLAASAHKMGVEVAYIDVEHSYNREYASALGVDVGRLAFSQPNSGEEAMDMVIEFARSGAVGLIVLDSVAALQTKAQIEGEVGDANIAAVARMLSQNIKRFIGPANNTDTMVVFVNQIRYNPAQFMGNPEYTTGGKALDFYASLRCEVKSIGQIKSGQNVIGAKTRIRFTKNKVAPPYGSAEFDLIYGEGITSKFSVIDMAIERGILQQRGSYFSYGGINLCQGKENLVKLLEEEDDIRREIYLACGVAHP